MNMNWKKILCLVLSILLGTTAVSLVLSSKALTVSRYERIEPSLTRAVRIVLLTDLHNSEFGENNTMLIRRVREQEPDLILLLGDLLNQEEARTDIAEDLIRELSRIAPVYASYGNHEVKHEQTFGTDFHALYSEAGATVLEFDWQDVTVNGNQLRIGGVFGYCLPDFFVKTEEARERECAFLSSFQDTERMTILLCHMPVGWIQYGGLDSWDVDLILAGHAHGGQIRFPWIGGLYAPDQGWFPGKCAGLYDSSDGERTLVLSRGLGNSQKLPRLNNIPEILVLDLLPEE